MADTRTTAAGTPVEAAARPTPVASSRRSLCLGLAVAWVALDVVTKMVVVARLSDRAPVRVIPGLLDLTLLRNPGSAFSLATGYTAVLSVIAVAVVVAVVRLSRRLRSTGWAIALGLLLGGAAGNLSDRIFRGPGFLRGYVVDWIHLYVGSHSWPVFNVADSGITVAAFLVVVLTLTGRRVDGTRLPARRTGDPGPADPGPADPANDAADDPGSAARTGTDAHTGSAARTGTDAHG